MRPERPPRPARLLALACLLASLACTDEPMGPQPGDPARPILPTGWMIATANGENFNSAFVTVSHQDNRISLEGSMWVVGSEDVLTIKLWVRSDVGVGVQDIGSAAGAAADVMWRPMYDLPQGWSAYGTKGNGTVTLTSLTADGAKGTFSFTAKALSPSNPLQDYRVTNGSFDVRF